MQPVAEAARLSECYACRGLYGGVFGLSHGALCGFSRGAGVGRRGGARSVNEASERIGRLYGVCAMRCICGVCRRVRRMRAKGASGCSGFGGCRMCVWRRDWVRTCSSDPCSSNTCSSDTCSSDTFEHGRRPRCTPSVLHPPVVRRVTPREL